MRDYGETAGLYCLLSVIYIMYIIRLVFLHRSTPISHLCHRGGRITVGVNPLLIFLQTKRALSLVPDEKESLGWGRKITAMIRKF